MTAMVVQLARHDSGVGQIPKGTGYGYAVALRRGGRDECSEDFESFWLRGCGGTGGDETVLHDDNMFGDAVGSGDDHV